MTGDQFIDFLESLFDDRPAWRDFTVTFSGKPIKDATVLEEDRQIELL